MKSFLIKIFVALCVLAPLSAVYAQQTVLSNEESMWIASRGNTISVIPEKNNPPFSFNDSSYISQGIFIDYIKLIGEKLNIKVDILSARTREEIIASMSDSKAEYVSTLEIDPTQNPTTLFNNPYATFPVVIAVRKDYDAREGMTLDDFNNKSIAVVHGSAVTAYIKKNYPRVILDEVVDNELALQKVALNEVDGTVLNSASLSYLLGKQSMRSIKVVGSVPLDSKTSFITSKDKILLNSILAKGLGQITAKEHQIIIDKWITLPNEKEKTNSLLIFLGDNFSTVSIVILIFIIIGLLIYYLKHRAEHHHLTYTARVNTKSKLDQEIAELELVKENLLGELNHVKTLEQGIKDEMVNVEK